MKNLALTGTAIAAAMLFSACDPQPARNTKPARGATEASTDKPKTDTVKTTPKPPKKKKVEVTDIESPAASSTPSANTEPKAESKPAPQPASNPEYGKKSDGKPGYIESPHSPGKMIDVRGLPPGTEIEDPYTRKPLLVP